jgi:hypothetical protein
MRDRDFSLVEYNRSSTLKFLSHIGCRRNKVFTQWNIRLKYSFLRIWAIIGDYFQEHCGSRTIYECRRELDTISDIGYYSGKKWSQKTFSIYRSKSFWRDNNICSKKWLCFLFYQFFNIFGHLSDNEYTCGCKYTNEKE